MSTMGDIEFLELFRDHLDEIRELVRDDSPDFIQDAHHIAVLIARTRAADEVAELVAKLVQTAMKTKAADLISLNLEARPHHRLEREIITRYRSERPYLDILTLEEDALAAAVGTAATLSEWLTPTEQYEYKSVPVFFATDRMPSGSDSPNKFFGGQSGPLSYGVVRVSIPDRHQSGHVERPWKLFPESPVKHVTLLGLTRSTSDEFLLQVNEALKSARERKLLLFIHGYNVPFADAVRIIAQTTFDLNFRTVPIVYSWPSKGTFMGYARDETSATRTREHFIETLRALDGLHAEQHLLAHSMGSRVAFQGLQLVDGLRFGQVILAAPDEDAETLESQMHRFLGHAVRNTLYASTKDSALRLSRWLHGASRSGQLGIVGLDSIDASSVNFSQFGHSYFHDQRALLDDIFLLVEHGLPPERRPSIRASKDGKTWIFQP